MSLPVESKEEGAMETSSCGGMGTDLVLQEEGTGESSMQTKDISFGNTLEGVEENTTTTGHALEGKGSSSANSTPAWNGLTTHVEPTLGSLGNSSPAMDKATATPCSDGSLTNSTPAVDERTITEPTTGSEGSSTDSTLATADSTLGSERSSSATVDEKTTSATKPTPGSKGSLTNSTPATADSTLGNERSSPAVDERTATATELTAGSEGSTNSTLGVDEITTADSTLGSKESSPAMDKGTTTEPTLGMTSTVGGQTTIELIPGSGGVSSTNFTPAEATTTEKGSLTLMDNTPTTYDEEAKLAVDEGFVQEDHSKDTVLGSNEVHEGEVCSMEVTPKNGEEGFSMEITPKEDACLMEITSNEDGEDCSMEITPNENGGEDCSPPPTSMGKASSMDSTATASGNSGIACTSGDGEECSRSATPTAGEVLTDSMVKEEKRLKEGGSREGSEEGDQRGEVRFTVCEGSEGREGDGDISDAV